MARRLTADGRFQLPRVDQVEAAGVAVVPTGRHELVKVLYLGLQLPAGEHHQPQAAERYLDRECDTAVASTCAYI